ncbi:hypothetical protein HLH14_09260 [Acinetobacter sp. ANC 4282]|nr:hypothetical protein [Acinetobacter terrae]
MKKLLLVMALMVSTSAFAVSTDSVRGSTGFVERGNSYGKMIDVLGSPDSSYSHIIHDRNGWPHKAITYSYSLNNVKYEITVVDGAVYSINWER